ncbi:MAG: PEP-CTERM system TPR-repeat protein PrsT [Rubrivivax sp.]|nr:PEP-CTERM system TPR-repeat protein PrsT [Rubrivivax sp.]
MNRKTLPRVAPLLLALVLAACGGGPSEAELVASAKALLDKKDNRAAIIQLKSALQKNSNAAEARFLLGKALLDTSDPTGALVELRKAQELQIPDERVIPEIARAMLLAGEEAKLLAQYAEVSLKDAAAMADLKTSLSSAFAVQRDLDKARSAAEDALTLKPGHAPALVVLAGIRAAGNDMPGALKLLDEAIAADPASDRAGVLKGDMLLRGQGDLDGAMAAYRAVKQAKPESVMASSAIAGILLRQGKLDEARAEVESLKKIAPRHPETLFLEAQIAFNDKDYKRSREITEQILKALPDSQRVLELAGHTEFRLKNYLQAEALLGKALKLSPKNEVTRIAIAQSFLRSGQPEKVVEVLQPLLEGGASPGPALSLMGEAYLQLGDARRSEEAFARAVKAAPQDARVRTSAALAQMARGNNAAAAGDLENIAAADKGPRADMALVSARLRQGDTAGALKAVDGLEKKLPDQPLAPFLRGRVLVLKKDYAGATQAYEAALARDANYFPAVAALAALSLANGKPEDARKRFEAHIASQPGSWQARLAMAELDVRTGAPTAKVVASLREAVKANPAEPRTHLALITRLIAAGDSKAALQAAQEANGALPNRFEIIEAQGRAELAAGDQQRAITTFKQLTSMQPRNPLPEMRLAEAYMAAKEVESARRALTRASELSPDLFAPRRSLAMLAAQAGKFDEALAIAREAQKRQPREAAGFVLEGEIESGRRRWDAAATALRAAQQRDPNASEVTVRLHAALVGGGKAADADRLSADWLKAHPKDASFLYYLGDQALSRNDLPVAETRYRAVLEVQPDNALALNNVAWLLSKQGKPGGLALAEKANQLLPDRAPLLDTLALALETENQLPKAIEAQKRAIAVDPKDLNLPLRLAKLYIKSGDKDRARAELEALARQGEKFAGQAEVASLLKTL